MKKSIAFCLVVILIAFGCCVYVLQKYPTDTSPDTQQSTTTVILTIGEEKTTAKSTQEKNDTSNEDSSYTKEQVQKILYDYAAEYSYNPDVSHYDVANFIMREDGKGAAVFTDKNKTEKSIYPVCIYTTKDYGKSWEMSKQIFCCEDGKLNLIYIDSYIFFLGSNSNQNESYIFFSENDGDSFTSLKTALLLEQEGDNLPPLYPELVGCDYESRYFLLGWKTSLNDDAEYCLITKHDSGLKKHETLFKNSTVLTAIEVSDGKTVYPNIEISDSYTVDNCFEGMTVLKNYAIGRPVTEVCKDKILHYVMKKDGKGVAVYGEYGGMHHVYASILYTEDAGNTWKVSNESFHYTVGESKMLYIDDTLIFLNYNSVTFSSVMSVSKDYGKTFKTILLSDLLGYKGVTALSLYPEVKEIDEKNKTFTVDWHSITDKSVLLTQKYDTFISTAETLYKDEKAIQNLIAENES